jgi:hypothetical protein
MILRSQYQCVNNNNAVRTRYIFSWQCQVRKVVIGEAVHLLSKRTFLDAQTSHGCHGRNIRIFWPPHTSRRGAYV